MQNGSSMKPTEVLVLSGLLLALCLTSLFALWRRANRIQSAVAGAPRIRWTYTPGSSPLSGIALAPNGTIHFAAADGIYALSPEGRLLWKSPLPSGPVAAAPTLAPSGTLYAACQSGMLFALDASGNLIWQSVSTQHKFLTPPALEDDDALYVADDYTDLFAFAPRLGPNLNWKQMSYSPTGSKEDILLGRNPYGDGWWRSSPVIGGGDGVYIPPPRGRSRPPQRGARLFFFPLPAWPGIGGRNT